MKIEISNISQDEQRKKDMKLITIFILIGSTILFGCAHLNKKLGMKDDNIVEESIEAVIERHSGHDLDLTPDSPER